MMNLSSDFEYASKLQSEEYSLMNDSAIAYLIQEQLDSENLYSSLDPSQFSRSLQSRQFLRQQVFDHSSHHMPSYTHRRLYTDNYEELLRLGERMGDAGEKGLRKEELELLPTFQYPGRYANRLHNDTPLSNDASNSGTTSVNTMNSFESDCFIVESSPSCSNNSISCTFSTDTTLSCSHKSSSNSSNNAVDERLFVSDELTLSTSTDLTSSTSTDLTSSTSTDLTSSTSTDLTSSTSIDLTSSTSTDLTSSSNNNVTSSIDTNDSTGSSKNSSEAATPSTKLNYNKIVFREDDADDDVCFVEQWEVVHSQKKTNNLTNININIYNYNLHSTQSSENSCDNTTSSQSVPREDAATKTNSPNHLHNSHYIDQTCSSKNNYNNCKNTLNAVANEGGADARRSEEVCEVCLSGYEEGDLLRTLPCLHHFHAPCIDPWIMSNAVCPNCRFVIREGLSLQQ